jgi:hypothetical protein
MDHLEAATDTGPAGGKVDATPAFSNSLYDVSMASNSTVLDASSPPTGDSRGMSVSNIPDVSHPAMRPNEAALALNGLTALTPDMGAGLAFSGTGGLSAPASSTGGLGATGLNNSSAPPSSAGGSPSSNAAAGDALADLYRLHANTLQQFAPLPPVHALIGQSGGSFRNLLKEAEGYFHAGTVGGGPHKLHGLTPFAAGSFHRLLDPAKRALQPNPNLPNNPLGHTRQIATLVGDLNQFGSQIHNASFMHAGLRPAATLVPGSVTYPQKANNTLFAVPGAGPRSPARAPDGGSDPLVETGVVTFTLHESGSIGNASFTLTETVSLSTLTLHQDDTSFTLDEGGNVSFSYHEEGTDGSGATYTTDLTGTDVVSTHDTGSGAPTNAGFDIDHYNQHRFWSDNAPAGVSKTVNGTDSISMHDEGVSTADDGTTFHYTVDDSSTDSYTDSETKAGSTDTITGDDEGSDTATVTESGTTTLADGTVVTFNVTDTTTDSYDDNTSGPKNGTDTFTDDDQGTDSLTVQETGTSTDGQGNTLNFTVSGAISDSFHDDDHGTDNTSTNSESDTFDDSANGSDSFSLHETGTIAGNGLAVSFTADDHINDQFSDSDDGNATDPTDGTDNFNDSESGSDNFALQENGTSTDSHGNVVTFAVTESSGDNFSAGDTGSDTETNGHDSGTDGFTDSVGGSDSLSIHESGDVLQNNILFHFTADDHGNDSFGAGDNGSEDLADDDISDSFHDTANGGDNLTVHATASLSDGNGHTVSFTIDDTTGEQDTVGDNGTDQEAGAGDTVTDHFTDTLGGSDSFSVHIAGTMPNGFSFSLDDQTHDGFTDGDTGTDNEAADGSDSWSDGFNDTAGGADTIALHESGTTVSNGNTITFSLSDSSSDSFTDLDNGNETETGGSDSGTDNVHDTATSSDSLSVHETGSGNDGNGNSVSFTIDDGS